MTSPSSFTALPEHVSFPELEKQTLAKWKQHRVFETCLEQSQGKPVFRFDDGPPFGTGKPHYGHILAGTIKDAVTRFAHQTGHHVPRRFGWDCHGLPVEQIVDKKLGITTREQVESLGLDKYNAECRQTVLQCADDWRETVARMGRFIDFDGAYTTMSTSYMESVWWAFAQLNAKSLLYRGYKVMPYSVGCLTSVSNMEAGLDFRDASDPTIVVAFELVDAEEPTFFLAWTTTAWTLPANMALGVNPEFEYVQVRDDASKRIFVLATSRLCELYKVGETGKYEVLAKLRGSDLVGRSYHHPIHTDKHCPVIAASFVSDAAGTGIVHLAPGHGEEDYDACLAAKVIRRDQEVPCAVGEGGLLTDLAGGEFAGRPYKATEREWIAHLKKRNIVVKQVQIVHRVAFCWRSGVPLIHRVQPSWFVRVEQMKERLITHNAGTHWQPDAIKTKRFHNWLAETRDWAVSRSRYWGTPLPVWSNADGSEIAIIGSIAELRARANSPDPELGADLHLDKLRHVTLRSAHPGGAELRLQGDTLDCWFESACAPFASLHYPFENRARFDAHPVADFVAEGLDQTRGWFFTLSVISCSLFDRAPFRNVIVNGLVLAEDGQKMSKLKQNYPDPTALLNECGADALRAYLLSSPVVHAEPLRFKKQGALDMTKTLLLPWFNVLRYFVENAQRYERSVGKLFLDAKVSDLPDGTDMDRWLLAQANSLVVVVRRDMAAYRLAPVIAHLSTFLEDMRTTYIALNRERLKGVAPYTPSSTLHGLRTLRAALLHLTLTAAPFVPFFSEYAYQHLHPAASAASSPFTSVHYQMIPAADASLEQHELQLSMQRMQIVLTLGRAARDKRHLTMKMPVQEVLVVHEDAAVLEDLEKHHSQSLINGLRCKQLRFSSDISQWMSLRVEPNRRTIGQEFGAQSKSIMQSIATWTQEEIKHFRETGTNGMLTREHVQVSVEFRGDTVRWQDATDGGGFLVLVDATQSPELKLEFYIREVARQAQQLRKIAKLRPTDAVQVCLISDEAKQSSTDAEYQLLTPDARALLQSLLGQEIVHATAELHPNLLISAPVVHSLGGWLIALASL